MPNSIVRMGRHVFSISKIFWGFYTYPYFTCLWTTSIFSTIPPSKTHEHTWWEDQTKHANNSAANRVLFTRGQQFVKLTSMRCDQVEWGYEPANRYIPQIQYKTKAPSKNTSNFEKIKNTWNISGFNNRLHSSPLQIPCLPFDSKENILDGQFQDPLPFECGMIKVDITVSTPNLFRIRIRW